MDLPAWITSHGIEDDVVLVDKPSGPTSFGIIRFLRKELNIRKIGHAGTLDPLASGLLIIGIGSGTKKLENYLKLPKTYEATILLGTSTTSGDAEGEILQQVQDIQLGEEQARAAVESLVGEHETLANMYSAIKVDGRPLYWYARRSCCPIEIPTRISRVRSATFHSLRNEKEDWYIDMTVDVESGTYIRTLAEIVGTTLGIPATLASLRRISTSEYHVEDALPLAYQDGILQVITR